MDGIQAIGQALKAKTGAALAATAAEGADPSNAFSLLLQSMGARFNAEASLNSFTNLESKLLVQDPAADTRDAADARDATDLRADEDDDKTVTEPGSAKSKSDDEDDATGDDAAAAQDGDSMAEDTAAQAPTAADAAAAQAAVAAAIDVPVVTQIQAVVATAAATQPAAIAETFTAEAATAEVVASEDGEAVVAAVTETKASTEAAQTVVVGDAPKTAQKSTGATSFQHALSGSTAAEATTSDEATAGDAEDATAASTDKAARAADEGPKEVRSARAQEQAASLSKLLSGDNRLQVQVSVTDRTTGPKLTFETSPYNIYSGYTSPGALETTANGQFGQADAGNALANSRSSAEQAQAQTVLPSPNLAPQPQAQASQQGSSSAVRADGAVPVTTSAGQSGNTGSSFTFSGFQGGANNAGSTQSAPQATATERPHVPAQQVIDQIKVNITRAAKAGLDRVTIQLKPAELGRIDVKLEMSEEHKVRVTVMADNKDTLQLLQSDSRSLERALNDAGLRTDTANLHFSLRSDGDPRANDGQAGRGQASGQLTQAGNDDEASEAAPFFDYSEAARRRGGVDTFA